MDTWLLIVLSIFLAISFGLFVAAFCLRFSLKKKETSEPADPNSNPALQNDIRSLRDEIMKMKENSGIANQNLSHIKESITKVSSSQDTSWKTINDLMQNVHTLQVDLTKATSANKTLNENVNAITEIFSSNYKRGDAGESSLYFIIENMFGKDNDIVHKQYLMQNGCRPDLFLKAADLGIPIDSKFPYDNYLNVLNSKPSSADLAQNLRSLKRNLSEHIKDVAKKYISPKDKTDQVFLYIPSQSLFDFINFNKDLEDVKKQAIKYKVILTAPNNFPAILRLVLLYIRNAKVQKHAVNIVENIRKMEVDFKRFEDRWNKIENRINGLSRDTLEFGTTTKKLKNHFELVASVETNKLSQEATNSASPKTLPKSESTDE